MRRPSPTFEEDITLAVHDFVSIDHPQSVVVEALGALDLAELAPAWVANAWLGVHGELCASFDLARHADDVHVTAEADPLELRHPPARRALRWTSLGPWAPPDVDADIEAIGFGAHSTHLILVGLARVHPVHRWSDEATPDRRRLVAAFSRTVLFELAQAICAHIGSAASGSGVACDPT